MKMNHNLLNILDLSYLDKCFVTKNEIKRFLNCSDEESFFILQKLQSITNSNRVPMYIFLKEYQINFNEERSNRYHNSLVEFYR